MTTLVLGARGFIGRHVVDALARGGARVVAYDRNADAAATTPQVAQVRGDFADTQAVERAIAQHRVTQVVHLVSTTLPKSSNEDVPGDYHANVVQTLKVLDLCVRHGVRTVLFMSSGGTVYGRPLSPRMSERHATDPTCAYGVAKLSIEKYLGLYQHMHGLRRIVVRAANPYGPGQLPLKGQGAVAHFVHRVLHDMPIEVWGDGSIVRDYFHVHDLAELVVTALASEHDGVFNAGSGHGTSLTELVAMVAAATATTPRIDYRPGRRFDVPSVVLDCERAERVLGWRPCITLRDGIAHYVDWYKQHSGVG